MLCVDISVLVIFFCDSKASPVTTYTRMGVHLAAADDVFSSD